MTEMYKVARPLLKGVVIEILSGVPTMITNEWVNLHKSYKERQMFIPNRMVNEILGGLPQFRGELVVGSPIAPDCYEVSRDFVEHTHAINLFIFWVYDLRTTGIYDLKRRLVMAEQFTQTCGPNIQFAEHEYIESEAQLEDYKRRIMGNDHFPGIVLREPFGTYGTEDEVITQIPAITDQS